MKRFAVSLIIIFILATLNNNTIQPTGNEIPVTPSYKMIAKAYQESYNCEGRHDYAGAIRAMGEILQAYPEGYTVNLRLGWLFFLNKNYSNSIYHYNKAVETAPDSIEAQLGYCYPLMAQNKYEEAEAVLYRILQKDSNNYNAQLNLAYVLRMQGKFEPAAKTAGKMLKCYPTDVLFLTEYALAEYGRGNNEKAFAVFADILVLDPGNSVAKNYLGKK